jgi:hypothetical protein
MNIRNETNGEPSNVQLKVLLLNVGFLSLAKINLPMLKLNKCREFVGLILGSSCSVQDFLMPFR